MKAKDPELILEKVLEEVSYDPITGFFTRLVRTANRQKIGERADHLHGRYMKVSVCGHRVRAHRLAWFVMTGHWPENDIDHKNLNKTDNSWDNLRSATRSQNISNKEFGAERGVRWDVNRRKWVGKVKHLGKMYQRRFENKEDALKFVSELRDKLFGPEFH